MSGRKRAESPPECGPTRQHSQTLLTQTSDTKSVLASQPAKLTLTNLATDLITSSPLLLNERLVVPLATTGSRCCPSAAVVFPCLSSPDTFSWLCDAPLAQLAEQVTLNHWVAGSIPARCTFTSHSIGKGIFAFPFLQGWN